MHPYYMVNLERVKGIEPSQPAWKAGTLPLSYTRIFNLYKVVEDGGFEPPKAMLTDLQSAPFGHSGIPPYAVVLEPVDGLEPPTC